MSELKDAHAAELEVIDAAATTRRASNILRALNGDWSPWDRINAVPQTVRRRAVLAAEFPEAIFSLVNCDLDLVVGLRYGDAAWRVWPLVVDLKPLSKRNFARLRAEMRRFAAKAGSR